VKDQNIHTVGKILKSNIKIVEKGNLDTPNTITWPLTFLSLILVPQ